MIPGVTDSLRLPRIAKIRLGAEKKEGKYPEKIDHFSFRDCPEVEAKYGSKCKVLPVVMFPTNDLETFFPTARKAYRKSGLFCSSHDGVNANRTHVGWLMEKDGKGNPTTKPKLEDGKKIPMDPQGYEWMAENDLLDANGEPKVEVGDFFEMDCPGEECSWWKRDLCKRNGRLFFVLPEVRQDGCYEIATSSVNSILDVYSAIKFIQLRGVSIAWLPFELHLIPKKAAKGTIYTLKLEFKGDLNALASGRRAIARIPEKAPETQPDPTPDDLAPSGGEDLDEALAGDGESLEERVMELGAALGMTKAKIVLAAAEFGRDRLADLAEMWAQELEERGGEARDAIEGGPDGESTTAEARRASTARAAVAGARRAETAKPPYRPEGGPTKRRGKPETRETLHAEASPDRSPIDIADF